MLIVATEKMAMGTFSLCYVAACSLPQLSCFAQHPLAGKYPEHVINCDSRQAIGYLAGLCAILARQWFPVLAPCEKSAVVIDFNLQEQCLALFHRRNSSRLSSCLADMVDPLRTQRPEQISPNGPM